MNWRNGQRNSDVEWHDSKLAILASHEFFRGLPEPTLDGLARRSRTAFYAAGASIFAKGDEGLGLLAVLDVIRPRRSGPP
jgi:hypothetical protein